MAKEPRSRIKEARAYFRATEEVSKPIAFLMLFFSLAFIVSVAIGLFLLGRWGYREITGVEQPVVVTTPDTTPSTTVTVVPGNDNVSSEHITTPATAPQSQSITSTTSLPNTGQSLEAYPIIILAGFISHQIYLRLKIRQ